MRRVRPFECALREEFVVETEGKDEQNDQRQTIGQIAAHPVLHLAAVRKGRRAVSSDGTANLLEVCRAYWQSNPDTFKGFFYAAGEGDLMRKFSQKDGFPVKFYQLRHSFAENGGKSDTGENLYRLFTPVDIPFLKKYQSRSVGKSAPVSDNDYIRELSQAVGRLLNNI